MTAPSYLLSLSLSLFLPLRFSLRIFVHFGALFSTFSLSCKSVRAFCLSLPLPPSLSFLPALPSLTPPFSHLTLPYSPLFTAALSCVIFRFAVVLRSASVRSRLIKCLFRLFSSAYLMQVPRAVPICPPLRSTI